MKQPMVKVNFKEGLMPWRVLASDNPYPSMSFKTKNEAVTYARQMAKQINGILKVQGVDGKLNEEYAYVGSKTI
jgi:hypothetical protein